ncbi:ATP-binding cassette domain-containing protein [Salipaludibacillus sp. HK11]|uniref:ATP-binding cassette domain-containing protein n=1 Tax=Salipaludibacillus sp. HK11 TaxID=3394320 RepID=UPI0039FCB0BD
MTINFIKVEKKIDKQFQLGPLNFMIKPGTVTALIGNNGAGKSTLIRLLTGMVHLDSGEINRFDNLHVNGKWREEIGYVPQTSIGYERFTLKQLAELHDIGFEGWEEETFSRLITRFTLPLSKTFDSLSVGMQKQALIILALSRKTKLLVMDEPLSGVDIESQEKMREEWVAYLENDPERSILFATHVPEEVKEFADYIVCMKSGDVTGSYEKDHLQQNYGRIWLKDPGEIRNLMGVIDVKYNGNTCEIISQDMKGTEEAIKRENYEIVMQHRLEFAEILRLLLQQQGGESKNDISNK